MPTQLRHTLDLAVRLLDTTSGMLVTGADVALFRDGKRVRHMEKGGHLILIDTGRTDFTLTVQAPGYELHTSAVYYERLDRGLPALDLHLIPGPGYRAPVPCLTLSGRCPGITSLTAVRAGESACLIREFEPRKRILTLFNPHRLELDRVHYALVNPDAGTYEPFSIVKRISDHEFKLDHPLEGEFGTYFPVCPLIFGRAGPEDTYCLRVRDSGTSAQWMVRWEAGGPPQFKTVDFRRPETVTLP